MITRNLISLIFGSLLCATALADVENRIIGGEQTSIKNWPSAAALVRSLDVVDDTRFQRQFCGANLIGRRWVLTAAHCLYDKNFDPVPAADIRVVLGIDNLDDEADELVVTNTIIHPDYQPETTSSTNDIALLELAQSTSHPTMEIYKDDSSTGTDSVVIGWGATKYDTFTNQSSAFPKILREVTVPVVSNSICNSVYGTIHSSQMCAGLKNGGKDSCAGDSGGPLMIKESGQYKQAGIVSYGAGCAVADAYGVYTRVASFTGWINDYVGGVGDDGSDRSDGDDDGLGSLFSILLILITFLVPLWVMRRKKVSAI